jgi:LPXTG-site transpeptidase (sortase) family protein
VTVRTPFLKVASMIGVSAIVLAGSSGQALAFGPGHVERTADAGERGVAVYAAHRDTHFRFLKDVAVGDEIEIARRDGKTFRYRADGASIVRFDQSGIDPFATSQELVLATCWPFDAIARGRVHMRKWSLSPRGQGMQKPGAVGVFGIGSHTRRAR